MNIKAGNYFKAMKPENETLSIKFRHLCFIELKLTLFQILRLIEESKVAGYVNSYLTIRNFTSGSSQILWWDFMYATIGGGFIWCKPVCLDRKTVTACWCISDRFPNSILFVTNNYYNMRSNNNNTITTSIIIIVIIMTGKKSIRNQYHWSVTTLQQLVINFAS